MGTDERFDESIGTWFEETAPTRLPQRVLDATFDRTRKSRQQVRWRGLLKSIDVTRSMLALGGTAAIVVAAGLVLSPRLGEHDVGVLPATPDAWSRVSIESSWATAGVDGLVAGPRGLLAFLGEGGTHDMQLSVSTDGRTWRLVPNDQFPSPAVLLPPQLGGRMPAVGTADGFLFVAEGNEVWASEDGYTWHRSADRAQDPDLRAGALHAVVAGGPGLIAVGGDNTAWYSEDGADWTLADVPASPTESFAAQGYSAPTVDMLGIVVAGDRLVAWGNAAATNAADDTMVAPVLWTSDDGVAWATVSDVEGIGWIQDVAAGPDGFVAIGGADRTDAGGIWFSADIRVWQAAEAEGFRDVQRSSTEVIKSSIAAASSGYVVAAGDGGCAVEPCPGARAVIWSSPDGRSWSRTPSDDRFEVADSQGPANHSGAWATSAAAWDSHFVVAGAYDASPVIWISPSSAGTIVPIASPTPSPSPTPVPTTATAAPSPTPADTGSFEPIAGRIVCGNHHGIWSFDVATPDPATAVHPPLRTLGCSSDGTRALIQKGDENLFVLHADGSETQVTEQLSGFDEILGSARPIGATISPDGSRVVFAGLTERGRSCHDGALFAVDAAGGPAEVLWESHVPQDGIVRLPTFSPDGTQIAFADGYCDSDHSVWVMNADGSDARQIVTDENTPLGGTHVGGLAWSPAGDRIAIAIDQGTYTFATDGSDFRRDSGSGYCWPGAQC